MGEDSEMRPFLASDSTSPTIWYLRFSSVSSSTRVTVAPNLTLVRRQFGNVDHFGAADLVFQFHDAAFDEALAFLGGVIFGILRQIAMGARFRDRLDDLMAVHVLEPVQLVFQGLEARSRHRNFFHHRQSRWAKRTLRPALWSGVRVSQPL